MNQLCVHLSPERMHVHTYSTMQRMHINIIYVRVYVHVHMRMQLARAPQSKPSTHKIRIPYKFSRDTILQKLTTPSIAIDSEFGRN